MRLIELFGVALAAELPAEALVEPIAELRAAVRDEPWENDSAWPAIWLDCVKAFARSATRLMGYSRPLLTITLD
jgi:hypothetical protein